MDIHPGWSDEQPIRLDSPFGAAEVLTNRGDTAIGNRHIAGEDGSPGPVHNFSPTNYYVMHVLCSFFFPSCG
jgi:hypothetical protein